MKMHIFKINNPAKYNIRTILFINIYPADINCNKINMYITILLSLHRSYLFSDFFQHC